MNENLLGIQVNTDKTVISKEEKTERILEIRVQAPLARKESPRPRLNLALVLDRSGSMSGEKLAYVKQAANHVLDQLNEQDQVAVVVYDDVIQVLAHSLPVTNSNRFELKQRIAALHAGNMTNLGDGWLTGCREIAASAKEGMINRALLLTDGLANVGLTDLEILSRHALELYKDSISTSTFGVGEGFNEHLLEAMANKGGGNFYYIATPTRIPDIFMQEFNDLIGIAARKVEITIDLPAFIDWKVLAGWAAEYKDGHLHVYVGDMLAGKLQDIYVKLQIPADAKLEHLPVSLKVYGQGESGQILEAQMSLVFHAAPQKDVDTAPLSQEVMQRFSEVELADTATEALKLERQGEREAASTLMQTSLNRNRPYAARQVSTKFEDLSTRIDQGLSEPDRKSSQFDVYNIKRRKDKEEK